MSVNALAIMLITPEMTKATPLIINTGIIKMISTISPNRYKPPRSCCMANSPFLSSHLDKLFYESSIAQKNTKNPSKISCILGKKVYHLATTLVYAFCITTLGKEDL